MSIANQYILLEDFAKNLHCSPSSVLKMMLVEKMLPVFALSSEINVYFTCWFSILNEHSHQYLPGMKTPAVHFEGAEFLAVDAECCKEILDKGSFLLKSVDALYSPSVEKVIDQPITAQSVGMGARIKDARLFGVPITPFILKPCFALFHLAPPPCRSHLGVCALEDISMNAGLILRLQDLRIRPEDEVLLKRSKLRSAAPAPVLVPISAPYISEQFGQLLEVYNEYQKRDGKDVDLHRLLLEKNDWLWGSKTLRVQAIKLIAPSLPPNARSKKRNPYDADGKPIKLGLLMDLLKALHEKNPTPGTHQYTQELKTLNFNDGELAAYRSIVRLTKSSRGGRRTPKHPQ